jgi:hypothetical protein
MSLKPQAEKPSRCDYVDVSVWPFLCPDLLVHKDKVQAVIATLRMTHRSIDYERSAGQTTVRVPGSLDYPMDDLFWRDYTDCKGVSTSSKMPYTIWLSDAFWQLYRATYFVDSKFPHTCTFCGAPAYIGAVPAALDCSAKCGLMARKTNP